MHAGAHTIGRSHCNSFADRLYNFNGTKEQDPSLNPLYAVELKKKCPKGNNNSNLVVPMNPASPSVNDVSYYVDILCNRGLFTSDQTLLTDPAISYRVKQYASHPWLWENKFAVAMVKMGQIGVLTGQAGEIRANCRVINSKKA